MDIPDYHHAVTLEVVRSGISWNVRYQGEQILTGARSPELAAARWLVERGKTGCMVSYREQTPCLIVRDIVGWVEHRSKVEAAADEADDATHH